MNCTIIQRTPQIQLPQGPVKSVLYSGLWDYSNMNLKDILESRLLSLVGRLSLSQRSIFKNPYTEVILISWGLFYYTVYI